MLHANLHLLTLQDYHRMAEVGILTDRDAVELIDGTIVQMSPKGSKHAACMGKINQWLTPHIQLKAHVRNQAPIQILDLSETRPDLALVQPREDFYAASYPTQADVLLIVEIADSSLEYDRAVKGPLYAGAGIAHYWIVNLREQVLELYSDPSEVRYRQCRIAEPGETVTLPMGEIHTPVEDWLV